MSLLNLSMKGQQCTFRTLHPIDAETYTGTIIGVGVDSEVAVNFTDIVSYNTAVRTADPGVSQDLTQLNFFIISRVNASGNTEKIAFAEEWVQPGSFQLISSKVKRIFTVYSTPDRSAKDIINVLRASGFTAVDSTPTA